jgi:putative ABC transport system ATP-binding protein
MPPLLLRVVGLAFSRPAGPEGDGFALEVPALALGAGQAVGVTGPSGCGKSTLVDLLSLLRRPDRARRFDLVGRDICALWRAAGADGCAGVRAEHVGVILQTGGLVPCLSVWENVMLPQRLLGRDDAARSRALLEALELSALARRMPAQLSIGQRQRVAVARALAHRPALVLADEPTAALGVEHAPAALALLLRLTREAGAALLVVSHDIALLRAHGVPVLRCRSADGTTRLEAMA